jgi:cytochrome c biogenesis protein CcdA
MISVSLEDVVFIACCVIGLLLGAATVLFRDELGELLARLEVDVESRRAPLVGVLIGFVSLFGFGGLVAIRLLAVHGGFAVLVAMVAGGIGAAVGWIATAYVRRPETSGSPSMRELVGRPASVAVAIPAGGFGSVYVRTQGRTHEYSATASVDIAAGADVNVTGAVGSGLVVATIELPASAPVLPDDETRPPDAAL